MTKRTLFLISALLPGMALAQPPAEVIATPQPETTTMEQPAAETQASPQVAPEQVAPVLVAPVAEPQALPALAAPVEDKSLKGITLAPSIGVYPIGFDSLNIGQGTTNGEGSRYFFALKPGIDLSTTFKTAGGKEIDFSLSYAVQWREYLNKEATNRDFDHSVDNTIHIPWNDRLSTDLATSFDYFYKNGSDDQGGDNTLLVDHFPSMWFKANDQLKLKVGYWMRFLDFLDSTISNNDVDGLSDPSVDSDELGRGDFASGSTILTNATPNAGRQNIWTNSHAAVAGMKYSPMKGTSLGMDYRFVFESFSNADTREARGHYFIPSISQDLPWEGGSISMKDEFRLQKYKYALAEGADVLRQNFRNRLTASVSQKINDSMTFEGFYRYEIIGENKDDYSSLMHSHWIYTGVNFSF